MAYPTRRVSREALSLRGGAKAPQAGDLVLARIESIGHHTVLPLRDGRRRRLFVGGVGGAGGARATGALSFP